MRRRMRKLIGTAVLAVLVPLYALIAAMIADTRLPGMSPLAHWLYYAVAGLIWVLPAGLLITWMQRPDKDGQGG